MRSSLFKNLFLLFIIAPYDLFAGSSYRKLVLTDSSAVTNGLTDECLNGIRKHIQNGLSFSTPSVFNYTTSVNNLTQHGQSDNFKFYHYTNSEKMKITAKERTFENLFQFLRNTDRLAPMDWNLYIAGDDDSSKSFGPIKTRISIDHNSYVFDAISEYDPKDVSSFNKSRNSTINTIENELTENYVYLKQCKSVQPQFGKLSYPENFGILTQLILTDSNVSLIAYYGLKSPKKRKEILTATGLAPIGEPVYWYQVIDAKAILDIEIIN